MKIIHGNHKHANAIFRHDGVFLDYIEGQTNKTKQEFIPYNELTLEFTNPVIIRITKANNIGLWYKHLVGVTFTAEAVNKGKTGYSDFLLEDGRLINITDCEII